MGIDPVLLTQHLIQKPSITPNDAGCLDIIAEHLKAMGFMLLPSITILGIILLSKFLKWSGFVKISKSTSRLVQETESLAKEKIEKDHTALVNTFNSKTVILEDLKKKLVKEKKWKKYFHLYTKIIKMKYPSK